MRVAVASGESADDERFLPAQPAEEGVARVDSGDSRPKSPGSRCQGSEAAVGHDRVGDIADDETGDRHAQRDQGENIRRILIETEKLKHVLFITSCNRSDTSRAVFAAVRGATSKFQSLGFEGLTIPCFEVRARATKIAYCAAHQKRYTEKSMNDRLASAPNGEAFWHGSIPLQAELRRRSADASGAPLKDLYEIGEIPPLGHVPARMYGWAIRKERHGPPEQSMRVEIVPTWPLDSHDVLVLVMAAGVNYNGVWAALGQPISVLDVHKQPFHIAGSDASGVVWAVGSKVRRWKVGDDVVVHCNQDDGDDEECNGGDPMFSASQRIWGYETPDGSFAQFCRVQDRQLMEKPKHLTWEESACYTLTLATAYRMLFGHEPHRLKPGDNVLVWGASGGLGVFGVQLCAASGANAIGIISDEAKRDYVLSLGAKGVINRKDFNCWGPMPKVNSPEYNACMAEARKFGKAIWDITGRKDVDTGVRTSRRADLSDLLLRRQARRHGRLLRRHHRLQFHLRRAVRLDAAETHPGLAFRASETGGRGQ